MVHGLLSGGTVLGDTLVVLGSIIILLALVKFLAWDKINGMMEARRTKIATDLDEAAQKSKEARAAQANADQIIRDAERKALSILQDAREAADKTREDLLRESRETVTKLKLDGQKEVEQMKVRAKAQMHDEIVDLSVALASQLLNKELTANQHQDVIDQFINELEG